MSTTLDILESTIAQADAAVGSQREPPPEAHGLRDLTYRMRKLRRAWDRPQSLGVFGPSQAGKSFLIGALLSHELGSLEVQSRTGVVDFLREINPAKGVESTGVVTRFSVGAMPTTLKQGDFYCRLLSLEVVLESLATGFLVECTAPPLDPERVERCLRDARLQNGPAAPAAFRDAWNSVWHDLLRKYQERHAYLNELKSHPTLRSEQWQTSIQSVRGWLMVYSLLWGGAGYASDLDELIRRLVDGLDTLDHAEAIEVGIDHVRASSETASVIDAACLNSIGTPRSAIPVYSVGSGRQVSVDPGVLSALIAEIRMQLRPVSGSLLDHTDILDFPGGRALRGIEGFGPKELNTGTLDNAIEVYKRGKLTFIFEQFSIDREITGLILCSPGPTKPEAIQLQSQVERWLQIRYGTPTPVETDEVDRPSLFMALTKFDMSLGALRSDNAGERWDARVREACVDFWARSHASWILNWGGKSRAFNNMFWVRNPYADQMLTLTPGDADFDAIKRGYLDSKSVQRFIAAAEEKWLAMEGTADTGLPRSGVPLLASHLRAKMQEDIKAKELSAEARAIHTELVSIIKSLTPSQDEAEERQRLMENAETLIESIRREMGRRYSGAVFGALVDNLTPPITEVESELRAVYEVVAPMSIKVSDKVKKVLVHMLKWWTVRGPERFRDSGLELPPANVERFAREVCLSKRILPLLGRAIFPYFSRTQVDFPLVASILQVKVCDAMLDLFQHRTPETPALPVRLSYSEVLDAGDDHQATEVDWEDVDFSEDAQEIKGTDIDIIFAGSRTFRAWSEQLPTFYVHNAGGTVRAAADDPTLRALSAALAQLRGLDLGTQ